MEQETVLGGSCDVGKKVPKEFWKQRRKPEVEQGDNDRLLSKGKTRSKNGESTRQPLRGEVQCGEKYALRRERSTRSRWPQRKKKKCLKNGPLYLGPQVPEVLDHLPGTDGYQPSGWENRAIGEPLSQEVLEV